MTTSENQKSRLRMGSLSDSFLSNLNTWLQWISVLSIGLGLLAAIGLLFVSSETGRRQEQQLAEANKKIAHLQPKPLKDRVLIYLTGLDANIMEAAKQGRREFEMPMTFAQLSEMQRLCAEDRDGTYIREIKTTNTMINQGSGGVGGIRFAITDELLK
jgi:hypothetical protein